MGLNRIADRDVAAYRRVPPTEAEIALADVVDTKLHDHTDWAAQYPEVATEARRHQPAASTDLT